jgi:hypothetical protein
MLKLKHIALNKCILDFLIGPCDEQFVVVCSLKHLTTLTLGRNQRNIHLVCLEVRTKFLKKSTFTKKAR